MATICLLQSQGCAIIETLLDVKRQRPLSYEELDILDLLQEMCSDDSSECEEFDKEDEESDD